MCDFTDEPADAVGMAEAQTKAVTCGQSAKKCRCMHWLPYGHKLSYSLPGI